MSVGTAQHGFKVRGQRSRSPPRPPDKLMYGRGIHFDGLAFDVNVHLLFIYLF